MARGWVYVISNPAMPGVVKVGFSTKDPELRAQELNNTGAPHPYQVDYDALTTDPHRTEQAVHRVLHDKREGREWFRCSLLEAIQAIRTVIGNAMILENNRMPETAPNQAPEPAVKRDHRPAHKPPSIRFSATFDGECAHCRHPFRVTVTRHDSRLHCPQCHRSMLIPSDIQQELESS